jgi:hypothetical protein
VAGSGTTVDINSGGSAIFIAGSLISFLPGFSSLSGSYCDAYITITGNYCSNKQTMAPMNDNFNENDAKTLKELSFENEDREPEINIYPNPTIGEFVIDFLDKDTTAEIYIQNFQGIFVRKVEFHEEKKVNIDIRGLPSGMYIILIKTESYYFNKKIIKTH